MDNTCTASANLTFVKYSPRDCVKARYIIDMMNFIMKVNTFDPEIDVSAGTPIIRSMETAIDQSRAAILLISKNFFKCKLCNFVLDDLLSRHILTKGKYRIILIALDKCKIPHSLKKLNCIYCCKYENNMKKYSMALQDCFLRFMRRMHKALKGPRHLFRRIRPRGFVKAFKHEEKILSRINCMIKRDCIRRENQEPKGLLNLYRLVKVSKHCILSCKYGDCSFSCSGQNIRSFEKHLDSCWYIPVQCCNKQCTFKARRHVMKQHSEECPFALVKCSHPNCNIRTQRTKLNSHERQCSNRIVSCRSFGCSERVQYKDLHNHLETCPWRVHTCKICNESTSYKDRAKHVCDSDTNECPHCNMMFFMKDFQRHFESCLTKCELCDESFPKIKQKHHTCPFMKCQYQYCDYTDTVFKVLHHMKTCAFEPKECPNCGIYVISKSMKSHLSECETGIKCVNCGLYIAQSKKAIHDLLLCIANDDRISCPLCQTLATEGSIKNEDDMALNHEMHSKNRVEHSVFADNDETTYKPKDEEEFSLAFLGHIEHTMSHPIDICPLRRSKSYCKSRKRFREIEKCVESNGDLRDRIREGLYSYPPLTVPKSRQSKK